MFSDFSGLLESHKHCFEPKSGEKRANSSGKFYTEVVPPVNFLGKQSKHGFYFQAGSLLITSMQQPYQVKVFSDSNMRRLASQKTFTWKDAA